MGPMGSEAAARCAGLRCRLEGFSEVGIQHGQASDLHVGGDHERAGGVLVLGRWPHVADVARHERRCGPAPRRWRARSPRSPPDRGTACSAGRPACRSAGRRCEARYRLAGPAAGGARVAGAPQERAGVEGCDLPAGGQAHQQPMVRTGRRPGGDLAWRLPLGDHLAGQHVRAVMVPPDAPKTTDSAIPSSARWDATAMALTAPVATLVDDLVRVRRHDAGRDQVLGQHRVRPLVGVAGPALLPIGQPLRRRAGVIDLVEVHRARRVQPPQPEHEREQHQARPARPRPAGRCAGRARAGTDRTGPSAARRGSARTRAPARRAARHRRRSHPRQPSPRLPAPRRRPWYPSAQEPPSTRPARARWHRPAPAGRACPAPPRSCRPP